LIETKENGQLKVLNQPLGRPKNWNWSYAHATDFRGKERWVPHQTQWADGKN